MYKILFVTGYAISHIYPIATLIKKLINDKKSVYCLGVVKNKFFIESIGANFIEYPKGYWEPILWEESEKYNSIIGDELSKGNISKVDYLKLKQDALNAFNFNDDVAKQIKIIVDELQPNCVFRDSTDLYWKKLKKDYPKVKTVGYITNNLYSWDYLYSDPDNLIPHFLGIVGIIDYLPKYYVKNFKSYITGIFNEISAEYRVENVEPYYQYNPSENINIIYSTDFLQPMDSLDNSVLNYIFYPEKNELAIENNIRKSLYSFIKKNDYKIVYISCGSFISKNIDYYISLIHEILQFSKTKVIVSCGNKYSQLEAYIKKQHYYQNVFVSSYIEQKYVLSKCDLFITSGGFNSIKEAIYYVTPMLVIPITPEQRLNGILIEELGIGYTTYKKSDKEITLKERLDGFETNSKTLRLNLDKYKELMINNNNSKRYDELLFMLG